MILSVQGREIYINVRSVNYKEWGENVKQGDVRFCAVKDKILSLFYSPPPAMKHSLNFLGSWMCTVNSVDAGVCSCNPTIFWNKIKGDFIYCCTYSGLKLIFFLDFFSFRYLFIYLFIFFINFIDTLCEFKTVYWVTVIRDITGKSLSR